MASPVADLVIRISADSAEFQNGLRNAEGWAKSFGKNVDTSFVGIATAAGTMVGAVVTGTAAMVAAFANTADAARDTARSLDMNVESLSRLRFAADLSGSSAGAMDSALAKMNKNIGEATLGTGEAAQALQDLGLNAQQLAAMGPEQAFLTITDALNTVESAEQRAAVGADIFGKAFADPSSGLSNVVGEGSEAIKALGAQLDELGATLDTGVAEESARFNDNLDLMGALSTGFAQDVSGQVLPTMNLLTEDFIEAAKNSEALAISADALGIAFKSVVTAAISVKWALGTVVDFLGAIGIAIERLISGEFEGAANAFTEFGEDRAKQAEIDASRIVDIWTAVPGEIAQGTAGGPKGTRKIADRKATEAAAKERANLAKQLEEQLKAYDSQEQQVENTLQMRQDLYAEFFEAGLINEGQYNELLVSAREDYWTRIGELDAAGAENERKLTQKAAEERRAAMRLQLDDVYALNTQIGEAVQQLADWEVMTGKQKYAALASLAQTALNAYSQTSKKAFEAAKVLSIGTTLINTYDAAVAAYKSLAGIPIVGPALGAAAAAAAIAFGMAQVRAISSTQFGGRGAGGGGVGGLAAPTGAGDVGGGGFSTGSHQAPQVTIVVQDDALISGATLRRIGEGLNEMISDGGQIVVSGGNY